MLPTDERRHRSLFRSKLGARVRLPGLVTLSTVATGLAPVRPGGTALQKWEYASVPLIPHAIKEILDNWGDDGWELVQIYNPTDVPGTVAILKRPKQ